MSDEKKDDNPAPEEEVKADAEAPATEEAAPEAAPKAEEAAVVTEEAAPETAATEETPAPAEKSEQLQRAEAILKESAPPQYDDGPEIFEKVVFINRCSKVVKGGRRFSFSALVVTGDRNGKVGVGFGKAKEVAECINKASGIAQRSMVSVKITENTIPHEVTGVFGGGRVLLRPASPGTGIIAGGGVRAVIEAAGVKDVLAKSMGSNNHANVVKATIAALEGLRTKDEIYALRGKKTRDRAAL